MGVHFPALTDPLQVVAVHPTQIYETIAMLFVFWWLWRHRDHGHAIGWLFACYLVFAGAERFLVEFVIRGLVGTINHVIIAHVQRTLLKDIEQLQTALTVVSGSTA